VDRRVDETTEGVGQGGERTRSQPVIRPIAVATRLDQSRIAKHSKVMTDERLRSSQLFDEMTHAKLLNGEQREDSPAHRLSDDPQQIERHRRFYINSH